MTNGFASQPRQRVFGALFRFGYRSLVSHGAWRAAAIAAVAPAAGERVLEVCHSEGRLSGDLAASCPGADVSCVQPNALFLKPPFGVTHVAYNNSRIDRPPAAFDKAICTFALHSLQTDAKFSLFKELRRVLRVNGMLYLLDFDQGRRAGEQGFLRAAATQYGGECVALHRDGGWLGLVSQAGFTSVRQMDSYSITIGRIALVRARRA